MAKRTRGVTPTSAYRPGQAPVRKSSPSPASKSATPASSTTPPSIDSAIALSETSGTPTAAVAMAPVTPTPATAVPTRSPVASHQRGHIKVKPNSLLAARASQEYVYVGDDLRHIAKVALGMLVVMILLYLIVVVGDIFHLY